MKAARFAPLIRFGLVLVLLLGWRTSTAQSWEAQLAKADTAYSYRQYNKAIRYYNRAIKASKLADRESQQMLYKRAFCQYTLNKFNEAIADLDRFISYYPQSPQPWILKAFCFRELGDEDKQMECLEAAIRIRPDNDELFKWRSMIYLQKDDFANAKKDALSAIALQDDPEAETYLGVSYYNLNQADSAYIAFNRAISIDATYMAAYLYAGSMALQSGDNILALEYLNLALRLEPNNQEALFYKGATLVESGKIDEGCKCLNRAFYAGFDDAADYLKEYCFGGDD